MKLTQEHIDNIRRSRMDKTNVVFDDSFFDLCVWTIMDGTVVVNSKYIEGSQKVRIQFKLSKQRKIDDLRFLLDKANIPYTFKLCKKSGVNKLQPYYIRIYGAYARAVYGAIGKEKKINDEWMRSKRLLKRFLKVVSKTDGHVKGNMILWVTVDTVLHNQFVGWADKFGLTFGHSRREDCSGFDNGKPQIASSISLLKIKKL